MIHGHEVLHMMEGKSYSRESLLKAIDEKFGKEARFYTCSAEDLTSEGLVKFLEEHGKFKPMGGGFTVDESRVCEHEG